MNPRLALTLAACVALSPVAMAKTSAPSSIVMPDKVETGIGALEFKDGAPS